MSRAKVSRLIRSVSSPNCPESEVSVSPLGMLSKCFGIRINMSQCRNVWDPCRSVLGLGLNCLGFKVSICRQVSLATGPYHVTGHRTRMSVQWGHAKIRCWRLNGRCLRRKLDASIKSFRECINKFLAVYWPIFVCKQSCHVTETVISGFIP